MSIFGDVVSDGISSLQSVINQFTGPISNVPGVIQAYQAAGNQAVGQLGPAIDSFAGGNPDVMKMTHWAWAKNGEIAAINPSAATGDDLAMARAALQQMVTWYQQAYRLAQSLKTQAPAAPAAYVAPRPAPAASATRPAAIPASELLTLHSPQKTGLAALLPTKMPPTPVLAIMGGSGILGAALGGRFLGVLLGGPIGFVAGAALGNYITKKLAVSV